MCFGVSRQSAYGALGRIKVNAELFRKAVKMHGSNPCMGYRPTLETTEEAVKGKVIRKIKQGGYKFYSYEHVDQLVDSLGRGICQLGIMPHQNVAILADTCFEWMCIAQALLRYNIPIVTLYSTLSNEGILHGLKETESVMLVTSQDIMEKMRDQFDELPCLRHVVYIKTSDMRSAKIEGKNILTTDDLQRLGDSPDNFTPEDPKPDDTAIIMYTSGSTGVPKGVLLSHKNMLAAAKGLGEVFNSLKIQTDDAYIAYLPLAHVFELNCEMIAILFGVKIGYSSPHTLTDNSTMVAPGQAGDCSLLQPTILPAVPLMLDRVKKAVLEKTAAKGSVSIRVLELAIADAIKRYNCGQDTSVYDKDIFSKIRSVVGGKVRLIATGSAPLSADTHSFIRAALGCAVLQGYGLTETCAAATCMEITDKSTGQVGGPVSGAFLSLEDWEEGGYHVADGRGEIILGGDMIAQGYYKNASLTQECFFEKDGIHWFRTGDIGELTEKNTIKIIDRKKDLVKLQHGEYVSLGKIETELKTLSIVDNICVYGSGLHTYLIVIVQPNQAQLALLASQTGVIIDSKDTQQIANHPVLQKAILEIVENHCKSKGFNRHEIPKKIIVVSEEWTPESGLVTAAMKLRRKHIQQKYQQQIDEIYTEPANLR